jgi:small subunit ribosomal protein S15
LARRFVLETGSRLGILIMVGKRRRLIKYLRKIDHSRFVELSKSLGLRVK